MQITVVCEKCLHNETDPAIEFNFKDQALYYWCPNCKHMNKILLKIENKPLPRSRRLGR